MSEILSKERLRGIETWYRYGNTDQAGVINALIASHRALQAERDALKDELAAILKERNDFEIRCDALQAELAEERKQHEEHCTEYELQMNAKIRQLADAKWARGEAQP